MPEGTVAVTGATGFVGRHVVGALHARGRPVRVLARDAQAARSLGPVEVVEGRMEDAGALVRLCRGARAVVHCAGVITARGPEVYEAVNALGTSRLVVAAREGGVGRFVLISSLAAREPGLSDYAASKRAGENVLRRAGDGLSWSILRPPAVYGPGDRGTLPLVRQLSRRVALIPGDRRARLSLIYVADLAEAVARLVEETAPEGEIHEVHDGKEAGYSWAELAAASGKALDRKVECLFLPRALAGMAGGMGLAWSRLSGQAAMASPGKVRELYHTDWVCRNRLLENCTDWRPRVGFAEGYRETVNWYREHGWL